MNGGVSVALLLFDAVGVWLSVTVSVLDVLVLIEADGDILLTDGDSVNVRLMVLDPLED